MISCARATRGLRRPSLDTRSGSHLARPQGRRCKSVGRSMRAMETTPAASLNTGEGVGLVGRAYCPIPPSSGLAPTNLVTGHVKIHVFHHLIHAITLARSLRASYNWLP